MSYYQLLRSVVVPISLVPLLAQRSRVRSYVMKARHDGAVAGASAGTCVLASFANSPVLIQLLLLPDSSQS